MCYSNKGFTLIELVIVVAVVAILAAVAFPSYQNQVNKGKRADAQNALLNLAALQERFYSDNGFYANINTITGGGNETFQSNENLYTVTVGCPDNVGECAVANRAQQYTLIAAPVGADALCGSLTYNQQSVRGSSEFAGDPAGAVDNCW